jgi:AraC-like DNA-binding protein
VARIDRPLFFIMPPGPSTKSEILRLPGQPPVRLHLVHATWGEPRHGRSRRRPHAHDVFHLVLVHAGAGSVLLGDESVPVRAPMLLLCPPGVPHIFAGLPGEDIVYSEATFIGRGGTAPLRCSWGELLSAWSGLSVPAPAWLVPDTATAADLEAAIQELVTDGLAAPPALDCLIQCNLARLLMLVLRLALAGPVPEAEDRLEAARNFIVASAAEAPSLGECARLARLRPKRFLQAFKQRFGLPPQRYRQRVLAERAATLLRCTGLPLAEVAARCGFTDPHYFSRWFARAHGQPPSRWRRQTTA